MKISAKLTLAVFVPMLVALVICAALAFTYRAVEVGHENGDTVRQIRSGIRELNHLIFSYLSYREQPAKQQFLAECGSLAKLIGGINLQDPEQQRLLEDIRLNIQAIKEPFIT